MTPQEKENLKVRFFGQHIGCKIETNVYPNKSGVVLCGINEHGNNTPSFDARLNGSISTECLFGRYTCKLILRPLSGITDEEAIECASTIGISDTGTKVLRHGKYLDVACQDTSSEMRFYFYDSYSTLFSFDRCDGQDASRCIDYLRSRNFCLPFHGLDPIAEGWAILETTNQPQG